MDRNSTHHYSLFLCLISNFPLQTSLDNVHHVAPLYQTTAVSMDSVHFCCHRELHFRCPVLSVRSELQTLLCLSRLISMKLKPSNSLKLLLLANLTDIGQRAKISSQKRNIGTHPSDLLRRPSS